MKKLLLTLIILIPWIGSMSYGQDTTVHDRARMYADQKIEVYYFHYSRRCATCLAVESESEKALKNLYPGKMESGLITFKSINLEEEINEPLAKKLQVSGQSLLIVFGDEKIDLTGDGFKYARTDPEKLQESFKAAIDPML